MRFEGPIGVTRRVARRDHGMLGLQAFKVQFGCQGIGFRLQVVVGSFRFRCWGLACQVHLCLELARQECGVFVFRLRFEGSASAFGLYMEGFNY